MMNPLPMKVNFWWCPTHLGENYQCLSNGLVCKSGPWSGLWYGLDWTRRYHYL